MAKSTTLLDKVAKGAAGIQQQSTQQLAANRGLVAAPVTAYGTALIGGGPDQAKMAGTPAQRAAATKVAAPAGETQLEQAQTLTTATETAEDKLKKEQAAKYAQSLGTFGAKVGEWIESAKKQYAAAPAEVQIDASDQLLAGLNADQKSKALDYIKKAAIAPTKAARDEAEFQLQSILGKNVDTLLTPEQKQKLYQTTAASITAATASAQEKVLGADRKLTLQDISTLGTTPDELASLLQVDKATVEGMSIAQLQQKIEEVSQQQFGVSQEARAGMAMGGLSTADRAALRQYLRDVETVGVAGSEAAVASLADQIDKNNQVRFAGKSYTVEELLATPAINDVFQKAITEMKGTTKTGPTLDALKKDEPALYKWLTDNVAGVDALIEQGKKTTTEFATTQKSNEAALGAIGQYQPALAKEFGYDPKALRQGAIDPATLPNVFKYVNSLPKEAQETAATSLAQLNKAVGKNEVLGLSPEQLQKLDLSNPTGPVKAYLDAAQADQTLQARNNINDVIADISAEDLSIDDLNAAYSGDNLAIALGMNPSNLSELDTKRDGKIDAADMPGIKEKFKGGVPSLAQFADGAPIQSPLNKWKLSTPTSSDPKSNSLYETISGAMRDNNISAEEKDRINSVDLNKDQIQNLANRDWSKVPQGDVIRDTFRARLQGILDREAAEEKRRADEAAAAEQARRDAATTPGPGDPPMFFQVINQLGEEGKNLVAQAKQGDAGALDRIAAITGVSSAAPVTLVKKVRKKFKDWGY